MKKTVVLNIVGFTPRHLGPHTPFLTNWAKDANLVSIKPVLPAVTCSAQATYLTGKWPSEHGIVGNGWYDRDYCEVKFWKQSNKLVQALKVWEIAKQANPSFTCANQFWWYNMYSSVDYSVTPRPNYLADGRKLPDCYTQPAELRETLQNKLGTFPLFDFWGPRTSIKSSQWIAEASKLTDELHDPTLTLIYIPHLDYNLQRYGNDFQGIEKDLNEVDQVCGDLIRYYESKGAEVLILSEYGITNVNRPIHLNRVLREHGLLAVRVERGTELLDAGASKAFAVADHQVAHIYVNDLASLSKVRSILEKVPGVELVLDATGKNQHHIDHQRSGELVVVADATSWFTYYYWLDDQRAPDFARIVDIHSKPGYDPVEMIANPEIRFLMPKVAFKVLKKKMGFRMLMDIIPLDASLIKGSHGRVTEDPADQPLLVGKHKSLRGLASVSPVEVRDLMLAHLEMPIAAISS